jgi:hypothetical protein
MVHMQLIISHELFNMSSVLIFSVANYTAHIKQLRVLTSQLRGELLICLALGGPVSW